MAKIKGYEFNPVIVRNSYDRKALLFHNKIINKLKVFGLTDDDIDIKLEKVAMRKAQASISWYQWGHHLFFSYNDAPKFVENLGMILQVIEYFIGLLEQEKITQEEFLDAFAEDHDIMEHRKNAREVLGVEEDSRDFEKIHANYKKLSKEHHPDMPNGDTEKFKIINNAHKILKKELRSE